MDIVRYYTREAGVRNSSARFGRSDARPSANAPSQEGIRHRCRSPRAISTSIGPCAGFRYGKAEDMTRSRSRVLLDEVGGELLTIEALSCPQGQNSRHRQLGEVMQESIQRR